MGKKFQKALRDGRGQRLWRKAKTLIPGGNQLLSKRAEMFLPEHWPAYYSRAKGAYIWDLDGRRYTDMSIMGVGANILGYGDPDVDRAAIDAVKRSPMSTLNAPEEVELAEELCRIHPWADMVRYARTGGESMAVAVRIARAHTRRDIIAFCGYHGWSDWYLATNLERKNALAGHLLAGLEPKGVPHGLTGTILPFRYNRLEELERIVKKHPTLAAIVMEPIRNVEPEKGFLQKVRKIADKAGAVLIFDEITIGWRLVHGGAHLKYGVNPDIAVFGKALSNGYPMAAIIGRRKIMQSAQDSFISSTYWTDRIGPATTLAALRKMRKVKLPQQLARVGKEVRRIWLRAAKKHGLPIHINGVLPLSHFSFEGADAQAAKTLFTQEMLRRGFLATDSLYASLAHTPAILTQYAKAVDTVFGVIAAARKKGGVKKALKGPVAHTGFQRLN
ncbi:aminotransferase class III-fold pyridoxal phosphate-dependent enzyme [Candidatus Kaiserbacteria bacterium]|nr:aminotransferase class III-fold pyridoxal phosphate-dependent enzyme [Candidatus Kaiserbacteria bacterium]